MRNTILKTLYGIAVFILTIFIMELFMGEAGTATTEEMSGASLPVVSMQVGDYQVNELHGFKTRRKISAFRAPVTPVKEDRTVEILFSLYGEKLNTLSYEVRDRSGERLIEDSPVRNLDRYGEDQMRGTFTVSNMVLPGEEYVLILKAALSSGEEIYYYTRLYCTNENVTDRIAFVQAFHNNTFRKDAGSAISVYIEPGSQTEQSNLSYVDIHGTYDQVTWGNFSPVESIAPVIRVEDIQKETATFRLDYLVTDEEGEKTISCTERYLVRQGAERIYLIEYERQAEEVFLPESGSKTDGSLALGITRQTLPYMESKGGNTFAFVQADRLYVGNISDNALAFVFGFAEADSKDRRELFGDHGIRILNVEENGNVEFMVYGYMNRGRHEGELGIVVYAYNHVYRTLEERAFIPYNGSFELLKAQVADRAYWNNNRNLYMTLDGVLYEIDVRSHTVTEMVSGLDEEGSEVSADGSLIAWKEEGNDHSLFFLNLHDKAQHTIEAPEGSSVIPLGFLQDDLIYGFAEREDSIANPLGGSIRPMYQLVIVGSDLEVLEEYRKDNVYVVGCEIRGGQAVLTRVRKEETEEGTLFTQIENDQIVNTLSGSNDNTKLTFTTNGKSGTVAELQTRGLKVDTVRYIKPKETAGEEESLVTLPETEKEEGQETFYVYNTAGALNSFQVISNAIAAAQETKGVVVDDRGEYRFCFSNRPVKEQIMEITEIAEEGGGDVEKCLSTILSYEGLNGYQTAVGGETDAADVLKKAMPEATVMSLHGVPLDAVLYYVSQGTPVLAMTSGGTERAVLITGYNEKEIVVCGPAEEEEGEVLRFVSKESMEEVFSASGNRFLVYLR
ncbi:MAG: hypothetical protein J5935_03285 [Lachnospiraceae bacterium]|nr:hypothetical protein [Lachnospiraceae bacterium]